MSLNYFKNPKNMHEIYQKLSANSKVFLIIFNRIA